MKRLIAIVLTVCMTFLYNSNLCFAEKAPDSDIKENVTASVDNDKNAYLNYRNKFADNSYSTETIKHTLLCNINSQPIDFSVKVSKAGFYTVGISYKATENVTDDIALGFMLDGKYPYSEAKDFEFPRMWRDSDDTRVDGAGNEYTAQQVPYEDYYCNFATNFDSEVGEKYLVYLTVGTHNVRLVPQKGNFELEYFVFGKAEIPKEYSAPESDNEYYRGKSIVIEGENADVKSSYYLVGKSDASTVDVTPHSPVGNVINYIGGGNWKNTGETLLWETPELKAGYYRIGFSFRQNSVIGGKTYRTLTIDGEIPFLEAMAVGFEFDNDWQQTFFENENGEAYLIYLSEGKHTIAMSVASGEIAEVRSLLTDAVRKLGNLYIDMTMITGENVDIYRDYELFTQISDMEERLNDINSVLNNAAERLKEITGQESGSNYSVIKNMVEIIDQMLKNKFEAHRYKSSYYSNYCSVSSVLQDLKNMPLDLDKIILSAPDDKKPIETANLFEQLKFSTTRFFVTFVKDYNIVSDGDGGGITVWVNWGRDQAQVLSSLIERSFTPKTKINVNLQLVNASMIQATLSGNGPDCALQHSRSEPVNLAMRGVLYDLSRFEDCESVLKQFQNGAEVPYRYKGGLYALPDTQTFFMMFYRKDILKEFNIEVPETWEEFGEVAKTLLRNNMTVWMPNNVATDVAQVNAGVGSVNIFPSLLLQNGLSLYSEDGKSTTLLTADVMKQFGLWTNYYTKMKFPVTLDFYNRFRVGTTPIGIASYTMYTTLKVAAPEIDGLWGFTVIPGTRNSENEVVHTSSGGGSACFILDRTENPEKAWEFLKWWTSAETQCSYSNDVESILGPAGRVSLSNVEAIKGLTWDEGMLDELLNAWEQVEEIPEYPGSYYVTRSIYQSFWNVVNQNRNPKDMLMQYGKEANEEIARKWKQYQNR